MSESTAFDKAFDYTMFFETSNRKNGGYTNDPDDPGGETKWGFSKKYNPDLDIKNLTKAKAKELAKERYWVKYKCDQIENHCIAIKYFDTIFCTGSQGVWMIQETLRKIYPLCVALDGKMGPETLGVLNTRFATPVEVNMLVVRYAETIRAWRLKTSKNKYVVGHVTRAVTIPETGYDHR